MLSEKMRLYFEIERNEFYVKFKCWVIDCKTQLYFEIERNEFYDKFKCWVID